MSDETRDAYQDGYDDGRAHGTDETLGVILNLLKSRVDAVKVDPLLPKGAAPWITAELNYLLTRVENL